MSSTAPAIVWFRDDLRLADHPALHAAASTGRPLICLYILEEGTGSRPLGGAARWWLDKSLAALDVSLKALGGRIVLRRGDPRRILPELVSATGAASLDFNRRYEAPAVAVDDAVRAELGHLGCVVTEHSSWLLFEPGAIQTKTGGTFRVFTPFWKAHRPHLEPKTGLRPRPAGITFRPGIGGDPLTSFGLHPTRPDWSGGLAEAWTPGEAGAKARLLGFIDNGLARYADQRDFPAAEASSCLSPHLRFGEVAVARVVHDVLQVAARLPSDTVEKFLAEIGWREFAWHLLSGFPELATRNFQPGFDSFPWKGEAETLVAWKRGRTGYPIVDAGMRELWQTGSMHNRVRMITASFLTKHLLTHWKEGEAWFWDTLVDADVASNPFGWQWVAGTGADAAPYFRVFNPVMQGEKFDPDGRYVRRYVPEIADVPDRFLHRPWDAPPLLRPPAKVYPAPVIDHAEGRQRALDAFAARLDPSSQIGGIS